MMACTLKDYEFWLDRLRHGHDALIAEQELETDEEDRRLLAINIQIAYAHLAADASPFRNQLTDEDRRVVAIANGIMADVGGSPS